LLTFYTASRGGKWKKVKPTTAKRVNQLTGLGLAQQTNENRI